MIRAQPLPFVLGFSSVVDNAQAEIYRTGTPVPSSGIAEVVRQYDNQPATIGDFVAIDGDVVNGTFTTSIYECLQTETVAHSPLNSAVYWRLSSTANQPYSTSGNYGIGAVLFDPTSGHLFESLIAKNINRPLDNSPSWVAVGVANAFAVQEWVATVGYPGVNQTTRVYAINEIVGVTNPVTGVQYIYKRRVVDGSTRPIAGVVDGVTYTADAVNWEFIEQRLTYGLHNLEAVYPAGALVTDSSKTLFQATRAGVYNVPLAGNLAWLDIGPANKTAAIDGFATTSTYANGKVVLKGYLPKGCDLIALIGVNAETVRLDLFLDPGSFPPPGFVAFSQTLTKSLTNWGGFDAVDDINRRATVIFPNLSVPDGVGVTITLEGVAVTETGFWQGNAPFFWPVDKQVFASGKSPASVAQLLFCKTLVIDDLELGASIGTTDFSVKSTDKYGTATLVPGNTRRSFSASGMVPKNDVARVQTTLQQSHGKNYLWIGVDDYDPDYMDLLNPYGFLEDLKVGIPYNSHCQFSFTIQEFI